MDTSDVPAWAQALGALFGTSIVAGALTLKERRKAKEAPAVDPGSGSTAVVAATFTERAQMERLTSALTDAANAVRENTGKVTSLTSLLERDFHRREVEAEVRQELRSRGIDP